MRRTYITSLTFILIAFRGISHADEQAPNEEKRLSNGTSLSLVNTTGNTETFSMAGKYDLKYKFIEKWTD